MNIRLYIVVAFCTILLFMGCGKGKRSEDQRLAWSSEAPLTIPYKVRIQRFEKGNLLRNPSFETGRTFTIDSVTTSFVMDGWQQTGHNITWTGRYIDSLTLSGEVFSGNRAVKIIREKAGETDDQGEGILSDFIKVIPGHYDFSMYMRLENVRPVKSRLGTKMYDGVDISLQFFDRNKIPIGSGVKFPPTGQTIDASFKGLSFANFNNIKSFTWGKIIGKSSHFPFPEGDIPSEAHYVKVFIGLKGTGTMWVDSVHFSYSKRNFSVAERMMTYTDTAFCVKDCIIPTPKSVTMMESLFLFKQGMDSNELPVIVVSGQAGEMERKSARYIQQALDECAKKCGYQSDSKPIVPVVNECTDVQRNRSRLIISIGTTAFYKQFYDQLPHTAIQHHSQGYFIHTPGDLTRLVIVGANSDAGLYYGALTLVQLIDNRTPVFHNARITDYPDFPFRFFAWPENKSNRQDKETLVSELASYKLNGALLFAAEKPANGFPKTDLSTNGLFYYASLPAGIAPDDSTLTYRYPVDNTADITQPVAFGCGAVDRSASWPDLLNELCLPMFFHNEMIDNSYYLVGNNQGDARKPLYAGSSYFSVNTDDADIGRYITYAGIRPVFMDNSMCIATPAAHYGGTCPSYPGKMRLYNIFEPFNNEPIREHFHLLDTLMFFVNFAPSTETDVIRLATAAEFLWNSKSYSADFVLWKVLKSRYGESVARELLQYADLYSLMLETLQRLGMNYQFARQYKTAQQTITELDDLLLRLGRESGPHKKLTEELVLLNASLRKQLDAHAIVPDVKK